MENNKKKDNALIKKNGLILMMKNFGVKRISPEALLLLEKYFKSLLEKSFRLLKQEIDINGRKTAKKEDILVIIEKLKSREDGWEI